MTRNPATLHVRYLEQLAPARLRVDRGVLAQANPGDTVRLDGRDGWSTFATIELGDDGLPVLACRSAVRGLVGLTFVLLAAQERHAAP